MAELLARAEAADQADVADGMSIPEELARREERLAKKPGSTHQMRIVLTNAPSISRRRFLARKDRPTPHP